MLNQDSAIRLAKILGMCGSDHPGERAAAALAAHRLVSDLSLTWQQVIIAPAPSIVPGGAHVRSNGSDARSNDWLKMARYCNTHCWLLTAVEQRFVRQMLERNCPPTERQADWLAGIYARVHKAMRGRI